MVKRGVKLGQVVVAVHSLSNPSGVSRSQIVKFCVRRFQTRRDPLDFDDVLEEALDVRALNYFDGRYYLVRPHNNIVWIGGEKGCMVQGSRRRTRTNSHSSGRPRAKVDRTTVGGRRLSLKRKSGLKKRAMTKINQKQTKCQVRKNSRGNDNGRAGKGLKRRRSYTPSTRSSSRRKIRRKTRHRLISLKTHCRRSSPRRQLKRKRPAMSLLRSSPPKKVRFHSEATGRSRPRSSEKRREFYRHLMRQTSTAVCHAQSWDRINRSIFRKQHENQELYKNSQMVHKILSVAHASSWDDMTRRLREIKEGRCQHVTRSRTRSDVKRRQHMSRRRTRSDVKRRQHVSRRRTRSESESEGSDDEDTTDSDDEDTDSES